VNERDVEVEEDNKDRVKRRKRGNTKSREPRERNRKRVEDE